MLTDELESSAGTNALDGVEVIAAEEDTQVDKLEAVSIKPSDMM